MSRFLMEGRAMKRINVDNKTQIFPLSTVVKSYSPNEFFDNAPQEGLRYYIGSDLARSPEGDFNVHTVIRRNSQDYFTIAYIQRTHGMDVDTRAQQIRALYDLYNPIRHCVDESFDGKAVIDVLHREHNVPVQGVVTGKPDLRYQMITNLVKLFERNRIYLPTKEGDFYTADLAMKLTKELGDMVRDVTPGGQPTYVSIGKHDDMVMSLALGIQAVGQFSTSVGGEDYFVGSVDELSEETMELHLERREPTEDTYFF